MEPEVQDVAAVGEAEKPNDGAGQPAEAQPQTDAEEQAQPPEGDKPDPERERAKLIRRNERLAAGRAEARREAELLRARVAEFEAKSKHDEGQEDEPKAVSRQDIERIATERARELTRQQTVATRADAVLKAGQKLPGFTEACNAVAEEVPFTDRKGNPTPFIEAVLDADKPAELLSWLGNNLDEAAALANLNPAQLGRRLAKLEDRLERDAKTSSKAPPPLTPARGVGQPTKRLEDLDGDDFDKRRREMIAKRR
jgi:BMFP domain-containing protein YqiC